MPTHRSTDRVRQTAAKIYIEVARRSGATSVRIRSGDLNKTLVEKKIIAPNRLPLVCKALASSRFQKENHVSLESIDGPPSGLSSKVIYTYRLHPVEPPQPPNGLLQLRGVLSETFAKLGGGERFHKKQREGWDQ